MSSVSTQQEGFFFPSIFGGRKCGWVSKKVTCLCVRETTTTVKTANMSIISMSFLGLCCPSPSI